MIYGFNYIYLFLSTFVTTFKALFGKEADKLEHANDDDRTYYLIEKESVVNKFISVPKDKGNLNCAAFSAGIIEGILNTSNFVCEVLNRVQLNRFLIVLL